MLSVVAIGVSSESEESDAMLVATNHSLSYDANGGTGAPAKQTISGITKVTFTISSIIPTRAGYTFVCWNDNSSGTGTDYQPGGTVSVQSGKTIFAKWVLTPTYTHTITFNANGGSGGPGTQTVTDTTTSTSMTISSTLPTRSGYVFTGWNTNTAGTGTTYQPGASISVGTTPISLYAKWATAYTHTLAFSGNGGTGQPGNQVVTDANASTSMTIPSTVPTRSTYTFMGWNTASDGSGTTYQPGGKITVGTTKITLYAKWGYAHTIIYNANGGSGGPGTQTVTDTLATSSIKVPTSVPARTGYAFSGWNTTSAGTGTTYQPSDMISVGTTSVTLYAQWIKTYSHTITYNANGGTGGPGTQTVTDTATSTLMTISFTSPTKSGYALSGWNTTSAGTGTTYLPGASISVGTTAITLYAMWGATPVPVTGITGVPTTATAGTPLTLTGAVAPSNATNKTITWTVSNAGTTGAIISGNTLSTTAAGTVVVTATIANGVSPGVNFTKDFNISVGVLKNYYVKAFADANSTMSPQGTTVLVRGSNLTYTFSANQGYYVSSVMIDYLHYLSEEEIKLGKYTFTDVMANHSIEVNSTIIPPDPDYFITFKLGTGSMILLGAENWITVKWPTQYPGAKISPNGDMWLCQDGRVGVYKGSNHSFSFSTLSGYFIRSIYITKTDSTLTPSVTDMAVRNTNYSVKNVNANLTIEVASMSKNDKPFYAYLHTVGVDKIVLEAWIPHAYINANTFDVIVSKWTKGTISAMEIFNPFGWFISPGDEYYKTHLMKYAAQISADNGNSGVFMKIELNSYYYMTGNFSAVPLPA